MKSTDVKTIYDNNYFLNAVDGYKEFSKFDGTDAFLFPRYQRNIELLNLCQEHKLLEIGCGRGEICIFHALRGGVAKGVDYSADAINLAKEKAAQLNVQVEFLESSFDELKELPASYDRILASEFIEHISQNEGQEFFREAFFMLKPRGKLLVFTYPNTWQRRFGYPIQRLWAVLHGRVLPKRQEDTASEHYKLYHLNEQNYSSLSKYARQAGFTKFTVGYDIENSVLTESILKRVIRSFISKTWLRHIFLCNLYLLAEK